MTPIISGEESWGRHRREIFFFATDPFKLFAFLKQESVLPSQQQVFERNTEGIRLLTLCLNQ